MRIQLCILLFLSVFFLRVDALNKEKNSRYHPRIELKTEKNDANFKGLPVFLYRLNLKNPQLDSQIIDLATFWINPSLDKDSPSHVALYTNIYLFYLLDTDKTYLVLSAQFGRTGNSTPDAIRVVLDAWSGDTRPIWKEYVLDGDHSIQIYRVRPTCWRFEIGGTAYFLIGDRGGIGHTVFDSILLPGKHQYFGNSLMWKR